MHVTCRFLSTFKGGVALSASGHPASIGTDGMIKEKDIKSPDLATEGTG